MDILEALGVIEGAIITKQRELDAMKVAQQVLQDTFAPQFTERDAAVSALDAVRAQVADLTAARDGLAAENASLQAEIPVQDASPMTTDEKTPL